MMKRHQLYIALGLVDKFFNTSSKETQDRILDAVEVRLLCEQAHAYITKSFPKDVNDISILPVVDADKEYAGYRFIYNGADLTFDETLEFDFGAEGIDVQN